MTKITTIGLDLAKAVFQVHGATEDGTPVLRRKLRRSEMLSFFEKQPPCLVGVEACGSAHHWAREISRLGHEVRLIPPAYVKPFVKRGKTDAADAEAICEAVTRKTMRFVPIKTEEQQAAAMVLKTRELLVSQRTRTINALRAHLAELGVVAGTAVTGFANLVAIIRDHDDNRIPKVARFALAILVEAVEMIEQQIAEIDERIAVATRSDACAKRLMSVPGVGVIIAASIRALVPDPAGFRSARHFAAWLGLTPKPHSSGGKERLGGISKMGNATLRSLLVVGATSVMCVARRGKPVPAWLSALMGRRPYKVAAVALANKMARIIWALLTKGGVYRPPVMSAAV
ncbi:MAG: IS110 family transposase [Ancalomicrobiaceae bacterium]|nr:IS110 family transposase [Ancalomicrobiaceae bacterium]